MAKLDLRIGCSGWSYKHWRGDFYPGGLPEREWLEHYASQFDTVELNTSFYRLPREAYVRGWHERVPESFCYAVKASRYITHTRRLIDCAEALERLLERMAPLGTRFGPLLYQLPPDFERDDERLASFLDLLPNGHVHAFEFRHQSWWSEDVAALLRAKGAVFVEYDMAEFATPAFDTGPEAYVRMHGPTRYSGAYSDAALQRWLERLRQRGLRRAWVYFNNDIGGHAPRDAARMRKLAVDG